MKRRLVLAIAGVAAAAVVMFALPLAVVLERSYRDEELLRLQRDTVAATRGIDLTRAADRIELPRFAGEIGIYTTAGARITGSGPPAADPETRSALRGHEPTGSTPGGNLVVAVPLLSGERITGVVRAQRRQAKVLSRSHRAWLALTGLGTAVLVLAVIAALALGRRLAGPLERLAGAARRVGEGDFAARAQATGIREIDDVGSALNSSSARVGELVSRERSFTADASHQLRTPLSALRLALEGDSLSESSEPSTTVTSALEQVDRLQTTIETLMAVARDRPTGEQETDLGTAVAELEARWHGLLAAEGRPLRVVVGVEHPVAAISSAVLAEITEVLMGNAHAHGSGAVNVVVRRAGDAYALDVSDQGPGFGGDVDQAFQRRTGDGHGIGLALARSLAHAQGARLQITDPGPNPTVSVLIATA